MTIKRNNKMLAICKALETVQPAKYQAITAAYGMACEKHVHTYLKRAISYGLMHKDANLLYTLTAGWEEIIVKPMELQDVYVPQTARFKRVSSVWDLAHA